MKVLLILHSDKEPGAGVIVSVNDKCTKDILIALLGKNKEREAFNLLMKKAIPQEYMPPGRKPKESILTLVEDDLR